MKKKTNLFYLYLFIFSALVFSGPGWTEAMPLTLNFDAISSRCNNPPSSYSEQGMTVTGSRKIDVCENRVGESQNLRNHRVSGATRSNPYLFEYQGGEAFDLLRFDLLARFRARDAIEWNPGKSIFTSSNGGSQTIDTLGSFTFSGAEWTGITWLRWDQEINRNYSVRRTNTVMDNLVFSPNPSVVPTPEPASFMLMGSGLFLLIGWRYLKEGAKLS